MSNKVTGSARPVPAAPSTLQRWFPIAVWLPRYNWGKSSVPT